MLAGGLRVPEQRGSLTLAVVAGIDVEVVDLLAVEREEGDDRAPDSATVTPPRSTLRAKNAWSSASVCRIGR